MHGTPMVTKAGIAVLVLMSAAAWGCSDDDDDDDDGDDVARDADAGTQPPDPPAAITGTPGQWGWLDVAESECANGEPTGLGYNIGTSKDLVVFFEGGGACWDAYSCLELRTASNIDGYTRASWEKAVAGGLSAGGLFDRTAANNPYKDSSFIYIPYCTADIHAGDSVKQFPSRAMHYSGRKNAEAFLAKIVPSFKDATRVTMTGRSAGGFGASVNYWRAKRAFGDTRVDLLDDSGPPFEQSTIALFNAWDAAWDFRGALPPDCAECQENVRAVLPYYARTYPTSRLGLLSYDQDGVISQFFFQTGEQFQTNLKDLTENTIAPLPNARYFVVAGTAHTMTGSLDTTSQGKALGDWINEFATDAASWSNVSP